MRLGQLFWATALSTLAIVVLAGWALVGRSRDRLLEVSDQLRRTAARRVEAQVASELSGALGALEGVERAIAIDAVDVREAERLEALLRLQLSSAPRLAEVTFTAAELIDAGGRRPRFAEAGRFQLSVFRTADGLVATRLTRRQGGDYVRFERRRSPDGSLSEATAMRQSPGQDPTLHPTFWVIARGFERGRAVWSDLHYSEIDSHAAEPRVMLSVQKAIRGRGGQFVGVVRVALSTSDLDAIARAGALGGDAGDAHRVALLSVSSDPDQPARLVARVDPRDQVVEVQGELRVTSTHAPPEIQALLGSSIVRGLDADRPSGGGVLELGGRRYLATLQALSDVSGGTRGWFVAVVADEAYYTESLSRFAWSLLSVFGASLLLVLAVGAGTLLTVRRGLSQMASTTAAMRRFEFEASEPKSALSEVYEVMQGLERAKTVVRAMGKYLPLSVVRRLYADNQEPALGGELREVTLLFTDIEGFTSHAEGLSPSELARRLGGYLEVVSGAVEGERGTIDKYIGDAVMAFWNAPDPTEGHAARACRAVLDCQQGLLRLYSSPAWGGGAPWVTRFGLHRAEVLVGHLGSPSHFNYTAIGDGVNLAARLESLCKQYGVTNLASADVVEAVGDAFRFRRLDRVAVKGKARSVEVFELLDERAPGADAPAWVERYERALSAYLARDFCGARELLEAQAEVDAPSRVLLARCRELQKSPPPADWNGVFVAVSK